MRILVVGAGAVGQVYAYHLQAAGAEVSVLVKPARAAQAARGFALHRLGSARGKPPETLHFEAHEVLKDLDGVAARAFDQVWLCVPTTALEGPWFEALVEAIGRATLVALQPGMKVQKRLLSVLTPGRIVEGAIGMVAYQTPLPGEVLPAGGIAFAFPPGFISRFAGEHAPAVVALLRKGGCPAVHDENTARSLAFTSAVIQPLMVALEGAGWSFSALFRSPLFGLGLRAAREALRIAAVARDASPPMSRYALHGLPLRMLVWVARARLPFDLERYLQHHFTKVGAQTRLLLPSYRFAGAQLEIATPALEALEREVCTVSPGVGPTSTTPPARRPD